MLTLEQIQKGIAQLSSLGDEKEIEAGIKDLFFEVFYSDQPLFIAFSDKSPYMTPPISGGQRLYLRLFSHNEVAKRFQKRHPEVEVVESTLEDVLQISKFALLSGCYGCILNESDKWTAISIPDFMSIFFKRIYGDESLYSQPCVDVLLFLNDLRRNSEFKYCGEIDSDGNWNGEITPYSDDNPALKPISIQSLFHVPTDMVHVCTEEGEFEVEKGLLLGGLKQCGFCVDANAPVFPDKFLDEPARTEVDKKDWHVSDIYELALLYAPINPKAEESAKDSPAPDEDKKPLKPQDKIKGVMTGFAAAVGTKLEQVKERLSEQKEDAKEEIQDRPKEEPVAPEEQALTNESLHVETEEKKKRKRILLVLLCSLLILCCVASVFAVKKHQYNEKFREFCTYIDDCEYGNAYAIYNEMQFGRDADTYMSNQLDTLVIKYANNNIGAEELSATMQALSNFPSLQQTVELAKLTAAKLEASKNSYVQGKESNDVYEKLSIWRQVLDLDSVNYAAVQQAVVSHQDEYAKTLNDEITYYSTRVRDFAKERYEVMAFWYPGHRLTQEWGDTYTQEQTQPRTFYPISISDVSIRQQENGYWTLYIGWKNTSVKTIRNICFSVIAIDDAGNYVVNEDAQGHWSIFDAKDGAGYEPGEGPEDAEYKWYGAFYGPEVVDVRLTAVNITYGDGSTATYTTPVDLAQIYQ